MKSEIDLGMFKGLLQKEENRHVKKSVDFLSGFLTPDKFDGLFVSFNGGKDATAALYLTLIALLNSPSRNSSLKCLYFREPNSFEEVDQFITRIRNQHNLEWIELKTKNFQTELSQLSIQRPVHYIIMGTRKDDPHCQTLGPIAPSDQSKGYPPFLRLSPLIDWDYEQVWSFIKDFGLPYCKLYDEGYTYLGNKDNTVRNKLLFDSGTQLYRPASLAEPSMQQKSRVKEEEKQ